MFEYFKSNPMSQRFTTANRATIAMDIQELIKRKFFTYGNHSHAYSFEQFLGIYGQCIPEKYRCNTQKPKCDEVTRKYRTLDGTCNNLENPRSGSINRAYGSILPPKYGNGYL